MRVAERRFKVEPRLRSFARVVTQNFGLKVMFQGEVACIGDNWMQIPAVENTEKGLSRAKYLVAHECSHGLYSQLDIKEEAGEKDSRLPYILNALEERTSPEGEYYVSLLKSCLADITSPFISKLETGHSNLTPRELEICHMVKSGFTSKQVAASLNTSVETVLKQRKMIRRKLGISNQKVNLVTHLKSLEHSAENGV